MTGRLLALLMCCACLALGTPAALARGEAPEAGDLGEERAGEDGAGDSEAEYGEEHGVGDDDDDNDDENDDDDFGDDEGDGGDESFGDEFGDGDDSDDGDDAGAPGRGGAKRISVALLFGYGFNLDSEVTGDLNPFGVGFGVRGGYNIDRIHVGGRLVFFLGESKDLPGGVQISANELTLGLVAGYDMEVSGVLMRPELGLGLAISGGESSVTFVDPVTGTPTSSSDDISSEDLYVAPGIAMLYPLSNDMFIGGEASIPVILADPDSVLGMTLMLTYGMGF